MFRHNNMGRLGSGVQSINHCCLPNSALDISFTDERGLIKTTPTSQMWLGIVESEESLNQQLQINTGFSASIKINDEISLSLGTKVEFARQVKFDKQSIYFMVKKQVRHDETLTGNPTLGTDAAKLIAHEQINTFYTYYGDSFINQITSGCEIIVIVQLDAESVATYQGTTVEEGLNTRLMSQEISQYFAHGNQMAQFKGVTHTSYWVYISGNKDGKSFVPDSSSFPNLLNSIYKLLQLDPDTTPEVPLSYRTLPYANAFVKSDVVSTVSSTKPTPALNLSSSSFSSPLSASSLSMNKPNADRSNIITRTQITQSLIHLQDNVRYLCGLHADVLDMLNSADMYGQRYDATWKKMMSQAEKYRGIEDKMQLENITENRKKLRNLTQELVEIDARIIGMDKTPLTLLKLDPEMTPSHNPPRPMVLEEKTALLDGTPMSLQHAVADHGHARSESTIIRVGSSKEVFLNKLDEIRTVLDRIIAQYPVTQNYTYLQTVIVPKKGRSLEFHIRKNKNAKSIFWRVTPPRESELKKQTPRAASNTYKKMSDPEAGDIPMEELKSVNDDAQLTRFNIRKKKPVQEVSCCARFFCCRRFSMLDEYQDAYDRPVRANGDYTEADALSNEKCLVLEGINNESEMAVNVYEVDHNSIFNTF